MDAPLARHLACFSRIPPVGASASPVVAIVRDAAKPVVTMTVAAFEAQLEATRDDVRAILEAEHVARKAGGDAAHAEALASAVAAAASRRDADEGAAIAVQIEDAMTDLRDSLARQASRALQALLAEAVAARTVAVVVDTIERVLADPDHPALTVRGPALVARAYRGDPRQGRCDLRGRGRT